MFYVVFLERAFAGLESTDREERLRGSARGRSQAACERCPRESSSRGGAHSAHTTHGFFLSRDQGKRVGNGFS